jgi:hypothetical protein
MIAFRIGILAESRNLDNYIFPGENKYRQSAIRDSADMLGIFLRSQTSQLRWNRLEG